MNTPLRPALVTALLGSLVALPALATGLTGEQAARVRVIHASPDTAGVDVLVNDAVALFTSLRLGDVSDYAEVPANVYDVKVVPAGAGPDAAVIQADLNLFYGTDYTVVAVNELDNIRPLVLVDDAESAGASQARIRFVHAVPDAPAVDIKVADGPYLFQGVSFEEVGDRVSVPEHEYALEVRVAGTDTVVLEVPDVTLRGASTYTLLAIGLLEDGSLDAMLVEDGRQGGELTPLPPIVELPLERTAIRTLGPRGDMSR